MIFTSIMAIIADFGWVILEGFIMYYIKCSNVSRISKATEFDAFDVSILKLGKTPEDFEQFEKSLLFECSDLRSTRDILWYLGFLWMIAPFIYAFICILFLMD